MKLAQRNEASILSRAVIAGSCSLCLLIGANAAFADKHQMSQSGNVSTQEDSGSKHSMENVKYTANSIIGKEVKDRNGEGLGEIQDIGIDWQNQKIAFVVLSAGGVMGVGDNLYKVPLNQLTVSSEGDYYTLNALETELKGEFSMFEPRDEQADKKADHLENRADHLEEQADKLEDKADRVRDRAE